MSTAFIVRGAPRQAIDGLRSMSPAAARADLQRPTQGATTTLSVLAVILSLVAVGIIGLMSYLSNLDRLGDFAVFKAIGVRTHKLLVGLVLQVVALTLAAALLAGLLARFLAPMLPVGVDLSGSVYLSLLGLAFVVCLLVSVLSVRQATSVDPALAFGRH